MFKRYFCTALTAALLLSSSAYAEAPTSQFGFKGWPYRRPSACPTQPIPTSAPEMEQIGGENGSNTPPISTKEPSATTSVVPTAPVAVVTPTPIPQATAIVTRIPTAKPTQKPAATKAPSSVDDYTTDSISAQEQSAWNLLNSDRMANGLSPLPLDAELSRIARIKSQDMRSNNYFAHESPTYGNVRNMLRLFGYSFTAAGENIAHHANVTKAQAAFMSSDGHRRNILSANWTKVGIGVAYDAQGYVYVTQIFAR